MIGLCCPICAQLWLPILSPHLCLPIHVSPSVAHHTACILPSLSRHQVTKTKGSEGVANILHMKEEFERRCSLLKVPPETAVEDKENIPRDDEAHDVRLVMRHYNFMTRDQFRSSDSVHHNWEEIYSIENTKKPGEC